jgi:nucleotide-binding universal stress UspA family protein
MIGDLAAETSMRTDTALKAIQRILVSGPPAGGMDVAEVGVRLAKVLSARLRLVHVQPSHPLLERLGLKIDHAQRAALTDADLLRLAQHEGLEPSTYEAEILSGQPRSVLLAEMKRWQADLLVVGAHERQRPGVRLGSVAEHLIRHATCPVLVVNGRRPIPPHRVLYPVDLSDFARYATACGANFLDQIARPSTGGTLDEALLVVPPTEASTEELEQASSQGLKPWLAGRSLNAVVERSPVPGSPASVIVERAISGDFDLIVMGTHGHGSHQVPLQGIGSVTGEVLDSAPCHMLIVPPRVEFGAELADAVVSQTEPRFGRRTSA